MNTEDFIELVDSMTPAQRVENFDALLLLAMGDGDGGDTNQSPSPNQEGQ